jgi:GT2 family glycosyltransferase
MQEIPIISPPSESRADSVPDMSVILVCWNNREYLEPCLNSLYAAGLHSSFDVVVVDNGSRDGSQAMLREKFPGVQLIQNNHNAGLGKASNQGIKATLGRHVLLLNNDTLVNGPSLDAMIEFLNAHPEAGAVGGRLINPDGSFQAGYAPFSTLREEFMVATRMGELLMKGYPSHADGSTLEPVGWLSSACLLLRRAALDKVGLLDEEYFIYGDEADLQYRLKQAGWPVYYLSSIYTIHYGGRSMDRWRRRKMVYRGKMLFYQKNYGTVRTGILRLMFAGLSLAKMLVWMIILILPKQKNRASDELSSNIQIIKLCLKLK